jgi:alpha-L-rhamnosidase
MHGEIVSDWKLESTRFTWTIRVPPNATATVFIPSVLDSSVTESNAPIERAAGIRVIGREGNALVCEAAAGNYSFVSTYK